MTTQNDPDFADESGSKASRPPGFWLAYLCLGIVLLLLAHAFHLVGFQYRRVVRDQPLVNPIKVTSIDGNRLALEDGRSIDIESNDGEDLSEQIRQSGGMVDLETGSFDSIMIHARQDGWVCGFSPYLINIPLMPVTVYRNRREIIAFGHLVKAEGGPSQ